MKKSLFFALGLGLTIYACSDKSVVTPTPDVTASAPVLPSTPYDYQNLQLPQGSHIASNFFDNGTVIIDPLNNGGGVTNHGATLGRVLFYDKKLSLNNTVSCGSCHHQSKSFADGQQFSKGFEGRITTRNSMAIVNPITQNNMFWDSRSKSIQDLSLKPVQNHIEMGMENISDLVTKINNTPYYAALLKNAFGSSVATEARLSSALSQFIGSITSNRAKIDVASSQFTELENLGKEIFNSEKAKCSGCHGNGTFAAADGPSDPYGGGNGGSSKDMQGATNIGLDLDYKDNGVGQGRFKIPTLRNVALTGPYMHDGRFNTLEEVVNHYSDGIKPHKALDPKFMDGHGNVLQMNLSSVEKKALVAFLHTLTDVSMTKNPKWSDPFKN